MSVQLVTLANLKSALRIEHNDDDAALNIYISAISQAVLNYIKAATWFDETGPIDDIPDPVRLATIAWIGLVYREPDGDPDNYYQNGFSTPGFVKALLYPYRTPTSA